MATMPTKNKYRKMIRRVTSESSLKARRGSPRNRRFRSAKSRMRSRSDADKSGPGSLSVDTELQSQDHTSKAVSSALHGQEGMSNDDRPTFTSAVDSNNEVDSVSPGFLPPMLSKYASADAAPLLSKYSQTSPKREHEVSFTSLPNIALPRMESVAEMPTKSSTLSKPSSPSHNFELSNVSGLSSNPRKSRRNIEPIDTRAADPTPPPVKMWRQKASYVGKEAVKAFYDMYRSGPSTNYGAAIEAKNPIVHAPRGLERRQSFAAGMSLMAAAAQLKRNAAEERRTAYEASLAPHSPTRASSHGLVDGESTPSARSPKSPKTGSPKSKGTSPRGVPDLGAFEVDEEERPTTPRRAYVKKIDELNLVPELFGVVHGTSKNVNVLSLRGYGVGDRKAEALGAALALKNFQKLDISDNRLSHVGARHLLTHLTPHCLELDMHENRVGVYGCLTVSNCILRSPAHELLSLNLAMNELSDEAVRDLASGLAWSTTLKRLNLCSNHITRASAKPLVAAIAKGATLQDLDLSWNNIGVASVVELTKVKSLIHLNIAWNTLGHCGCGPDVDGGNPNLMDTSHSEEAVAIGDALAANTTLLHLDLSGNQFSESGVAVLGEKLEENHTLLGLHLDDQNNCVVDSIGFVHPIHRGPEEQDSVDGTPKLSKKRSSVRLRPMDTIQKSFGGDVELAVREWMNQPFTLRRFSQCDHCWICTGSVETTIEVCFGLLESGSDEQKSALPVSPRGSYDPNSGIQRISETLWKRIDEHGIDVHMSTDGFIPHAATRVVKRVPAAGSAVTKQMSFRVMRCLPPGRHYFYFAVPDAAAREAQLQASDLERHANEAAAAAAEAIVADERATNDPQGQITGAATAARKTVVAAQRPYVHDKILSANHHIVKWHPTSISEKALWKLNNIAEAKVALESIEPHCRVNMIRVRSRNKKTALECQIALPRTRLANEVASIAQQPRKRWKLQSSIFAPRAETADSRDFFDTDRLHQKIVAFDWEYNKCKQFAKFEYSKSQAALEDIDKALFQVAEKYVVKLLDIFRTGCVCFCDPTGPPFSMKINAFTALCKSGGLADPWEFDPSSLDGGKRPPLGTLSRKLPVIKSKGLTLKEIDLIFIKTNIELRATKGTLLDKVNRDNPSNAINRFELTEALVRIAAQLFTTVGCDADVPDDSSENHPVVPIATAFAGVIERCWQTLADGKRKGPDGIITKVDFRADVLYTAEVDGVLKAVEPHLQRMFHNLSDTNKDDKFDTSGTVPFKKWVDFVQTAAVGLVPAKVKLDRVRMAFVTAKMAAVQCVEEPNVVELLFVDFVEALVRLAVLAYKPTKHKWPAFMSVCALFVYHFHSFRVDRKDHDPIAYVLRRYADDSPYELPVITMQEEDDDGLLSPEQLAEKLQKESEVALVWDAAAKGLHSKAKAMGLVHDHKDDDDD